MEVQKKKKTNKCDKKRDWGKHKNQKCEQKCEHKCDQKFGTFFCVQSTEANLGNKR